MNNDFWNEFFKTLFVALSVLTLGMVIWWCLWLGLGAVIP